MSFNPFADEDLKSLRGDHAEILKRLDELLRRSGSALELNRDPDLSCQRMPTGGDSDGSSNRRPINQAGNNEDEMFEPVTDIPESGTLGMFESPFEEDLLNLEVPEVNFLDEGWDYNQIEYDFGNLDDCDSSDGDATSDSGGSEDSSSGNDESGGL